MHLRYYDVWIKWVSNDTANSEHQYYQQKLHLNTGSPVDTYLQTIHTGSGTNDKFRLRVHIQTRGKQ